MRVPLFILVTQYSEKKILLPLGISEICFSNELEPVKLTTAYSHKLEKVEYWVLGEFEAAGGVRATIGQMKEYLKANINQGRHNSKMPF
ncbi:MAG: hypothetical protein NDI69_01510 [Bacteriovoracaceae bacterium]|nr:hypothetical protein [Bacteriovoracaceae bacterium]